MRPGVPYLARSRSSPRERPAASRRPLPREIAARDLERVTGGSNRVHQARVAAVLQWCALQRIPATEIHTGPRVRPFGNGGFQLLPNRTHVGLSDVLGCIPPLGRLFLVEVKTGSARRTPEQRAVHERFRAAGALCLIVRDVARDLHPLLVEQRQASEAYAEARERFLGPAAAAPGTPSPAEKR